MYSVWCTGEHEFYDLKNDPYQMKNSYLSVDNQLVNRLDALLAVLKSCRAETCRDPWGILHPNDNTVKTLKDALHERYDAHYSQFRKVQFEECIDFYKVSNELPVIGQHFISNTTESRPKFAPTNQHVISKLNKREDKSNENSKFILPKEYHDLFKLVPESNQEVGQTTLNEDFEKYAIPVDAKLIETPVNWAEYNFYGFGN